MATTYDKASLVMIPSGYKDDKLFSIKPTDGSGDFTFSRDGAGASPATRVNASGLIEKGRENILTYSNDFSNAAWVKVLSSVTGGQSGYDGTNNAWRFESTASGLAQLTTPVTNNALNSFSIYAKAGNISILKFWVGSEKAFDLANGTTSSTDSKITQVGASGWYRCEVFNIHGSFNPFLSVTGAGQFVYIQSAQAELGLVATDYIETTTAPVSAGLLGDMPRLDYSGGATCPSLLLEPSRVNIQDQSEYIASWSDINSTQESNYATSPEGVQNATRVVMTSATGEHSVYDSVSVTSGTQYTQSIFLKQGDGSANWRYFQFRFRSGGFGGLYGVVVDLQEGTIGYDTGLDDYGIENYGNGWYRVWITATATTTSSNAGPVVAFNELADAYDVSIVGDTNADVLIWGSQFEAGSYPTSYIPTYGSAAPRAGDNCDLSISSLGLTMLDGGSFYFDFVNNDFPITGTNKPTIQLASGAYSNYLGAVGKDLNGDGNLAWSLGYSVTNAYSLPTAETRYKCAFSWDATNLKVFVNGSQVYTTSSFTSAEYNTINLNYSDRKAITEINQVLLFDEQLTDAECIALTTI